MISFTYRLTGSGWAEATISDGVHELVVDASYLTDALGDLVRIVITLLEGAKEAQCAWLQEPGESHWLFTRRRDEMFLRIIEYKDWEQDRRNPKDRGRVYFKTHCPLRDFATVVRQQLTLLLDTLGRDGYKRAWVNHSFPLDDYRQLSALLQTASA